MGKRFSLIKNIALWIFVPLAVIYCTIYFGLPYFANKNDYSKKITNLIKESTGLIFLIDNYKIEVSPTLNLTIKADEIQGIYPNKIPFIIAKKTSINISTHYLLKKELRISKIKADEIQFSTKLLKSGKTTIQDYIEKNIKNTNKDIKISNNVPEVLIKNYILKLKDEESGQKLKITGQPIKITQAFDFGFINIETKGNFYCSEKKYTTYNIKAVIPKNLFSNISNSYFDLNINDLNKYDFYGNVNTDIKIYEKNGEIDTFSGKIHIDNFTMNLGTIKLPSSYIHIDSDKKQATITSKIYTALNEYTDIQAYAKLQKKKELNVKCICKSADIENLQNITSAVLSILKIKNDISSYKANGNISANFDITTDFKTIKSNGSIKVTNTNISNKTQPFHINNMNGLIDFANNTITIKNSQFLLNKQLIKITGNIHTDTTGEIHLSGDNLEIKNIIKAFPSIKLPNNITVKKGNLSFNTILKGKFSEISPQTQITINDFAFFEKNKLTTTSAQKIKLNINGLKDNISGVASAEKINFYTKNIPNNTNSAQIDNLSITFNNNEITIKPTKINLGEAKLILSGIIKNYKITPYVDINTSGTIDTKLLREFIPNNSKIYSQGYIPLKINIKGKKDNIKLNLKALANQNNYITPVIIKNCANTLTNINVVISTDLLNIEDFTMYSANDINNLLTDINTTKLKKLITIKGKIKDYAQIAKFDNLTINIPEYIKIIIPNTANGSAEVLSSLTLNNQIDKPHITGAITFKNIALPQYATSAENATVMFTKTNINTQINALNIADSSLSINTELSTDFLKTKKINNIKINAQTLNIENMFRLLDLLPNADYAPGYKSPLEINSGSINIQNFKLPPIKAMNITGSISSNNNVLYLKQLSGNAYGGKFAGDIKYNLPYLSLETKIQGREMNAESIATDFLPKEQKMSGRLNFDAALNMIGLTEQQIKNTVKGDVNLSINNGHLGQLGRFEHFLYAQNLLSQKLINASLNSAKQAIIPKDTGYITYLKGNIKLSNGTALLTPILTSGPHMSMYVTGNINLITNYVNLSILGKVSSEISNSMGTIGSITIKDLLAEHTKYGQNENKQIKDNLNELPQMDTSKIPKLSPDYKYQTKDFRVAIIGDPSSIKSVKSFTWIGPIKNEFSTENKENPTETYKQNTQTPKQTSDQALQPSFLENIPDYFHD